MLYLIRLREQFLAPSRWVHGLLNLAATYVALEISEAILVRNLYNDVYPIEADSIGIPLMGMMLYAIVSLICLFFAMGLVRQSSGVRWIGYTLLVLIALGYLVQVLDWGDALHYPIGVAQASLGVLILAYLYLEIRRYQIKIRSTPAM
jgi:hypothetical protein